MAHELEGFAAAAGLIYPGAAQALRGETGSQLPSAEQAIMDRILAPAIAALSGRQRQEAFSEGQGRPLPAIIDQALSQVPAQ